MLAGIMLGEEGQELLYIVLTVLIVEVNNEGDRREREYLHFFGFTVYL